MRKIFLLLAAIGVTSSALAALTINPYTFDTDGPLDLVDGWRVYCSGSAAAFGWSVETGNADVSGGTCTISPNPIHDIWGYTIIHNDDNALDDIGNPEPGVDMVEIHFDVISGTVEELIMVGYYDAANSFPTPNPLSGYLRRDEFHPSADISTPGHYVFTSIGAIPVDTVSVSIMVGTSGPSTSLEVDNVWLGMAGTYDAEVTTLTIVTEPNFINTVNPSVGENAYLDYETADIVASTFLNCPDIWLFQNWQGDVVDPNSASTQIVMDTDKTITAVYTKTIPDCGDLCHPILQGDMNGDCYVNFDDFVLYMKDWLVCTHPDCD